MNLALLVDAVAENAGDAVHADISSDPLVRSVI
jgi:hypothetical protein